MAAWTNDKIDILVCALFFFPWLEWSINLNQEKSSNVMFSTTNMRYSHIVIYVNFGIITLLYFHCKVCYIVYDCTPYSNGMYSLNIYIMYVIQILVKHCICNIPLHHYFIISLFFIYCGIIVIREWDQCLLILWVILPHEFTFLPIRLNVLGLNTCVVKNLINHEKSSPRTLKFVSPKTLIPAN